MPGNEKDGFLKRVNKYRAYGLAFLTFVAVMSASWLVVQKVWAFSKKVEVYVGLPGWLEKVEGKVDKLDTKVNSIDSKVDILIVRSAGHRERTRRAGNRRDP